MTSNMTTLNVHRRQFLEGMAAVAASWGVLSSVFSQDCLPKAGTVRDKLWVFCNPRNADYNMVRKRSVMSPLESAVYLGVPNILMVNQYPEGRAKPLPDQDGWFQPFEPPLEQYAFPLKVLKRVAWSIVGAGGITKELERKQVLEMALQTPNFVGVYMDDFFHNKRGTGIASLTFDQLRAMQQQLKGSSKKLDLFVTLYTNQFNHPIADYLKLVDVVTLWTWETADLTKLDANMALLEKIAPKSRKMLGCYTAEYSGKRTPAWTGMPVHTMQRQCDFALRCLRDGRIEGIIIYGCTTMDLGWESVDWTRRWIQQIGEMPVPG